MVAYYKVIEVDRAEVPADIFRAIEAEQARDHGFVYSLQWDDPFIYHGEEGWAVLDDSIEPWLEKQRDDHHIREDEPCYLRIRT